MQLQAIPGGVRVRIVVVYDIPVEHEDYRRRLREYLKNFGGKFLQLSVYEVEVSRRELDELIRGVEAIVRGCEGKVKVLFPCRSCYEKIRQVGVRLRELGAEESP
ncbi:MAG: CRISPR-associated endonuclease Cas2 [Thermoprotei archaeon]|nr:MAG: CRISPR-associated endonuclease Cas2 [Thermoprotei archaeon]